MVDSRLRSLYGRVLTLFFFSEIQAPGIAWKGDLNIGGNLNRRGISIQGNGRELMDSKVADMIFLTGGILR